MKKLVAMILSLALALSLASCGEKPAPAASSGSGSSETDPYADYPNKTIEVVVPYGTGGTHDLVARLVAPYFSDLGYDVQITNISGASGMTGTNEFLSRDSDGYSIVMMSPEVLAGQAAVGTLDNELWHDLEYIGCWVRAPRTITVDADSPYQTLDDLIAACREKPGELNWEANGSTGASPLGAQLTWDLLDIECNYVPSENVPDGVAALMGGHVDAAAYLLSEVLSYHEAGELRILAISAEERSPLCPDIPTLNELGYKGVISEYDLTRCWAVKGDTPEPIIEKLRDTFKKVYDNEDLQNQLIKMGANPAYMTGDELQACGDEWFQVYKDAFAAAQN